MRIVDFNIFAGDTKTLSVTCQEPDGTPTDISGADIEWRAARSLHKAAVIEKSTSDGISITDAANGVFDIDLEEEDTEDLKGAYYHEARITFSDGEIATVIRGTMTVEPVLIRAS